MSEFLNSAARQMGAGLAALLVGPLICAIPVLVLAPSLNSETPLFLGYVPYRYHAIIENGFERFGFWWQFLHWIFASPICSVVAAYFGRFWPEKGAGLLFVLTSWLLVFVPLLQIEEIIAGLTFLSLIFHFFVLRESLPGLKSYFASGRHLEFFDRWKTPEQE